VYRLYRCTLLLYLIREKKQDAIPLFQGDLKVVAIDVVSMTGAEPLSCSHTILNRLDAIPSASIQLVRDDVQGSSLLRVRAG
jgi:hypothetical protein